MNNRADKNSDRRSKRGTFKGQNKRSNLGRRTNERYSVRAYYSMIIILFTLIILISSFVIYINYFNTKGAM